LNNNENLTILETSGEFYICFRATTRKHTKMGQKYFKGGKPRLGAKYTKYNK